MSDIPRDRAGSLRPSSGNSRRNSVESPSKAQRKSGFVGSLRRRDPVTEQLAAAAASPSAEHADSVSSSSSVATLTSSAPQSSGTVSAPPSLTATAPDGQPVAKEDKRLRKLPKIDEHKMSLPELEAKYKTSITRGLTDKERAVRLRRDGPNVPRQSYETAEQKHALDWDRLVDALDGLSVVVDGSLQRMQRSSLVVGDIVLLVAGDMVPADIRVIKSSDLSTIHTNITGKDDPIRRSAACTSDNPLETENMLWARTWIATGSAVGIVWGTGSNTVLHQWTKGAETTCWTKFNEKIQNTVALLQRRNFFVKRPDCLTQLGDTQVLVCDVSLVLEERARLSNAFIDGEIFGIEEVDEMLNGSAPPEPLLSLEQLQFAVGLCNNAEFHRNWRDVAAPGQELDSVLAQLCTTLDDLLRIRATYPLLYSQATFSVHHEADSAVCWLWIRGTPEYVTARCSTTVLNGREQPITEEHRRVAVQAMKDLGSGGEFVVAYARCRLPTEFTPTYDYEANVAALPQTGFTFCGMVSVVRQLQKDVLKSLKSARELDLMPVFVTPHHPASVLSVGAALRLPCKTSIDCDLVLPMVEDKKRFKSDDDLPFWQQAGKGEIAFCNCTSVRQKVAICKGLQEKAKKRTTCVARSVDDGWELRAADVVIAPGGSSYPAKVCADALFSDDNLSTLIYGIQETRKAAISMSDIELMESTMNVDITPDSDKCSLM